MGIFSFFHREPAPTKTAPKKFAVQRNYDAAEVSRLEADWLVPEYSSGDSEIYKAIVKVRERAREQARNNAWVASYRAVMERNVIGPTGFVMRSLAVTARGKADKTKREAIEFAHTKWARSVSVDGRHNLRGFTASVLDRFLIDGEVFVIRRIVGGKLRLRIVEADALDYQLNDSFSDGRDIRMGVERDFYGKPLAYYFFKEHPGDVNWAKRGQREHIRIDAKDVIHFYKPDRPCDTRGISPLAPALWTLKQLTEYEKAELVAARKQASEGVYFKPQVPDDWPGNIVEDEDDEPQKIDVVSQIGQGVLLPPGVDPVFYNPTHPNSQFTYFVTECVRRFAASVGLSFHTLAGNLENVNYSSAQIGGLEERSTWAGLQSLLVSKVLDQVFTWWLDAELLAGGIQGVSYSDLDRVSMAEFNGRVWPGADPRKDAMAAQILVDNGWQSPQAIIRQTTGRDPWTVLEERKEWLDWHAELGLDVPLGDMVTQEMKDEADMEDKEADAAPVDPAP